MTLVAVTGASGFVGTHVVAALAARGASVVAASRTGAAPAGTPSGVRWTALDLADDTAGAFDRLGRPDALVHLAWEGLPNYGADRHIEVELPRQAAFIEAIVAQGLPALVVAGTCLEYGMQDGALSEMASPQPATAYAVAKDQLRIRIEALQHETPFALTWARLFYMYGEGQAGTSLYSQLRAAVANGDAAFDMSGGEQVRDFLPVGVVAAYLAEFALRRLDPGVVNVCSGAPVSVRDLVETWLRELGVTIHLNLGRYPYPEYEPMAFWGDPSKLNRFVGALDVR